MAGEAEAVAHGYITLLAFFASFLRRPGEFRSRAAKPEITKRGIQNRRVAISKKWCADDEEIPRVLLTVQYGQDVLTTLQEISVCVSRVEFTFFDLREMKHRFEADVELFPMNQVLRFESDSLCRYRVIRL